MKKYFIYFSLTGNGDDLAEQLKEKGYEPIKVEMVKKPKKVGFFTILKYGGRAMTKKREKINELKIDLHDDDLVIVGSPIWNDRLSTPIWTVLDQLKLNKETTKFILYPAGKSTNKSKVQLQKLGFVLEPLVVPYPLKYVEETKELIKDL